MRKKNNNIIEINGKRYDAATGTLLSAVDPAPAVKVIDVIAPAKPTPAKPKPARHTVKQPRTAARRTAPHHVNRKPAPAHTLMRQAVHKPAPSLKRRIKVIGPTDSLVSRPDFSQPFQRSSVQPDARLQHAHQIGKSRLVSRFSAGTLILPPDEPLAPPAAQSSKTDSPAYTAMPALKRSATADLLERALQQATSHLEPAPKVTRRRFHRKRKAHATVA